ncbi:MAG: FAD-dependent oxidoreductase [Chloroflexi bacterium]|nr:FAD-dependent oxidoreductase [Chloroflexota bacterium]
MIYYHESARDIPIVEEADVVVCGAGPAGVAAAIAAARSGAKTRLLELQGCLGGMWTAGLISWVIESKHPGIMQEINAELDRRGARLGRGRDYAYDPEVMKLLLEELCVKAGVHIQMHTRVVAAGQDGAGRITHAITESASGRQAWAGRVFIDATGNGDLAALAGCGFDVGREGTGETQPMGLICLVAGVDMEAARPFLCLPDEGHQEAKRLMLAELQRAGVSPSYAAPSLFPLGGDLYVFSTNHEYGVSGMDAADLTRATIHARAELHQIVNGLRSLGGIWRHMRLVATGAHIGIREGRRIHGLYQVSREDLLRGVRHEDAVCRVTVGIDVHSTDPKTTKAYSAENRTRTLPYDIPLRALIARDVPGLLMAGRCISGDFLAHASYRMTGTSATLGQAAGVLAAVAARQETLPANVPWSEVRPALQAIIESA